MEFDVRTNTKEFGKNIKLQGCIRDLQYKVKEFDIYYWGLFCEDGFRWPIWVL